mgnify:FL=1
MKKQKACIAYISSRNKCLKHSMKSVWDNYNYKHNYPVYVHYFDDIYDNLDLREEMTKDTSQITHWTSVPYETPRHIKEEELYY